jgi:hypothetical protein
MIKIILLVFLISPLLAHSADWKLVATSRDHEEYFVDLETIKTDEQKGSAQSWIKTIERRNGSELVQSKALVEYDCRNRKYRLLSLITYSYNPDGEVKTSYGKEDYTFRHIAPETITETIMLQSCKVSRLIDAYNEVQVSK